MTRPTTTTLARTLLPAGMGTTALAALMGWFALLAWNGFIDQSARFLEPALVSGFLIVLVGSYARASRMEWYVVLPLQVLVCTLFVNHHYAARTSVAGWVPTPTSLRFLAGRIHDGAMAMGKYASPVGAEHSSGFLFLLVCAVGVLLAIDLLACGLRWVPLAGLPVLVVLTIPISVLDHSLSWIVFISTSLLFMMLLATEETRRVLGWGRTVAGRGRRLDTAEQVVTGSSVRAAAIRIGLVSTVGALVIPFFVPVAGDVFGLRHGSNHFGGPGPGVAIVNPLIDLHRNLVHGNHQVLVTADTNQPDPAYLRTTVLDEFTGNVWRPSPRNLPKSNRVHGALPPAPGLASTVAGATYDWKLRLAANFSTVWLPTPYPVVRSLRVGGDWRFDNRTLDIVDTSQKAQSGGLAYSAVVFTPSFTAGDLNNSFSAPGEIAGPMTFVPNNLPKVIYAVANRVTTGAHTAFQEAVDLQDWFRSKGGFTYSTKTAPGSGMAELARFITTDKVGYCEQFAAAMAVMGRSLGIPSRVVVGFLHGHKLTGHTWAFTSDDLHAWPEMYFSGYGWVRFEPTPGGRTGASPAYTRQSLLTTGPSASASIRRPAQRHTIPHTTRANRSGAGARYALVPTWAWPAAGLVALLLLLGATPRLLRDARRRRWLAGGQDPLGLATGVWSELRASALDLRIGWLEDRTVRETLGWLVARIQPTNQQVRDLEELAGFVERARYARAFTIDAETEDRLLFLAASAKQALVSSVPRSRVRRAEAIPPSVFSPAQLSRSVFAPVGSASGPSVVPDDAQVGERV